MWNVGYPNEVCTCSRDGNATPDESVRTVTITAWVRSFTSSFCITLRGCIFAVSSPIDRRLRLLYCAFNRLAQFGLTKRERKDLHTGIKEFNLKGHVFDRPFLPDQLIHSRLSNLARAIGAGIGSMIVAGGCAIQLYLEANGRPVLRRALAEDFIAIVGGLLIVSLR